VKENGLITIYDPGADRPLQEIPTLQCVHCGGHFPVRPGSGKMRGYCTRCHGPVCSRACSGDCVPLAVQLENMEAGRPATMPRALLLPVR